MPAQMCRLTDIMLSRSGSQAPAGRQLPTCITPKEADDRAPAAEESTRYCKRTGDQDIAGDSVLYDDDASVLLMLS